jgi:hypothetical protein
MQFLKTLRDFLSNNARPGGEQARARIRDAWNLDSVPSADADAASPYDVNQWRRKLRRIFEELPDSKEEWAGLMTEARAYGLEAGWIDSRLAEEFTQLIRSVVADRLLSEADHDRIETARKLIGLTESQAETAVRAIVAEAEQFFGGAVVEES